MNFEPLNIAQLEEELNKTLNEAEKHGAEWVEAKATYEDFEDKRKSMLASLMPNWGPQSFKAQQALSSDDWKTFLAGLSAARKVYLHAQITYDLALVKIETLRSILSTRREEIRNFRG